MHFDDNMPIYLQIKHYICQQIITRKLPPGSRVPALRQLALDLTVNVNTVQRALNELVQSGVLVSKRGTGNFVTDDQKILQQLRQNEIETQLAHLYQQLHALKISPQEMVTALQQYLKKQEAHQHDQSRRDS